MRPDRDHCLRRFSLYTIMCYASKSGTSAVGYMHKNELKKWKTRRLFHYTRHCHVKLWQKLVVCFKEAYTSKCTYKQIFLRAITIFEMFKGAFSYNKRRFSLSPTDCSAGVQACLENNKGSALVTRNLAG